MGSDLLTAKVTNNGSGLYVLVVNDVAAGDMARVSILKPGESSVGSVDAFGVVDEGGNFVSSSNGSRDALFWKIRDGAEVEIRGTPSVPLIVPEGVLGNLPGMVTPSSPESWGINRQHPLTGKVSLGHQDDMPGASVTGELAKFLNSNFTSVTAAQVLEMVTNRIEQEKSNQETPTSSV